MIIISEYQGLTEDMLKDIIDRAHIISSVKKSTTVTRAIIAREQYRGIVKTNPAFKDINHKALLDKNRTVPMRLASRINGVAIVVL